MELRGGQPDHRPRGIRLYVRERPMQPHHGVLKDIVGVVPAADLWKPCQHPARENPQATAGDLDDSVPGIEVAGGQRVSQSEISELSAFSPSIESPWICSHSSCCTPNPDVVAW